MLIVGGCPAVSREHCGSTHESAPGEIGVGAWEPQVTTCITQRMHHLADVCFCEKQSYIQCVTDSLRVDSQPTALPPAWRRRL